MSFNCEVREQAGQPALSIRTRTSVQDLPKKIGEAFGAIAQYLADMKEPPAGPPFTAYYNMDMQDLDVEFGFPVTKLVPGRNEIRASDIPAGKVATCLYTGPYSEIGPAYEALSAWMKENGHEGTGVAYEMYLNDPSHTPPQELRTQIAFPLKGI
jgi:effector-binding domain-containing protein